MTGRFQIIFSGIMLTALLMFTLPVAAEDMKANNIYERGRFELDDGNYRDALRFFEQAMELDPENLRYKFAKGQALFKLQRFDDAEAIFMELMNAGPESRKAAYVELGALYGHTKRFKEAAEYYTLAIGAFPDRADLYLARGAMYMEMERYDTADEDFQEAGRINPDLKAAVKYHQALIRYRQEDLAGTITFLDQAGALSPDEGLNEAITGLRNLTNQERKARKKWAIFTTAAVQYDDNLKQVPDSLEQGVSGKYDSSFLISATGIVYLQNNRAGNSGFFYNLRNQSYTRETVNDTQSHTIGAFYSLNADPWYFQIKGDFGYYFANHQDQMNLWALRPSLTWLISPLDRLETFGSLEYKARHDGWDDSTRYVLGSTYFRTMMGPQSKETVGIIGRLGFQLELEDPDGEQLTQYHLYEIKTGMSFPLPFSMEGDFGLAYARIEYDQNPLKYGGLQRNDQRFTFSAKVGRTVSDNFRFDLMWYHTDNNSNLDSNGISIYSFKRNVYSLVFTGAF